MIKSEEEVKRNSNITSDCVISEWRKEPIGDEHNDLYLKFLRSYYFPFLVKYSRFICVAWLCIFVICIVFGPSFLSKTRSDLDVPKGTPSADALEVFKNNYPNAGIWPPAFVVQYANEVGTSVVGPFTKALSVSLDNFASTHSAISSVSGYWELMKDSSLSLLAKKAVSSDNGTMISTVYFKHDAVRVDVDDVVADLLKFTRSHDSAAVTVHTSGLFALFKEMQDNTKDNFALIDGIVIPVCILVLGYQLQSYRHMFVCICTLGCTLLLAFAFLVPITDPIAINPFAPSIMMSLGIAVCFDYSLFMLSRFREEIQRGASKEDAVFACLASSGHVVVLSGCTLFCTFILLLAFPQAFLNSVGWGCGTVVVAAIICNMSITPAMLLAFDCLMHFDLCPSRHSVCCYIHPPPRRPQVVSVQSKEPVDEENRHAVDPKNIPKATGVDASVAKKPSRSFWFKITFFVTEHSRLVLLVAIGITIAFFVQFLRIVPTSDDALVYLQGSDSLEALQQMKKAFNEGSLDPYSVILTTGTPSGVLSETYFSAENGLVHRLIIEESKYMNSKSVTSLSFFNDKDVSYTTYQAYTTVGSLEYSSSEASAYRQLVLPKMNADKSTSLVTIETTVPPNAQVAVSFIRDVRRLLVQLSADSKDTVLPLSMYLFGAYTTTLDVQDTLYKLVPIMLGVTCAIALLVVGFSFGSIGLALRLGVTTFMGLSWTYGLMVMVYQPGPAQDAFAVLTPTLHQSTGLYWIIPIMSFSILVGLALDYDIFLMSRVVEFRRMGWSDRAAVCLAIERTGGIISSAGLIMSISFAGLLFPKAIVLNQYGFSLFIGVAFDTFLVRTFLVPAVVTAFGKFESSEVNWYPSKMPKVLLSPKDEDAALWEGCWSPKEASGTFTPPAPLPAAAAAAAADI